MKHRLLVKVLMLPVVLACYLLISGVPAASQSENCSNRTLVGDYGFTIEGTILDANAPIRGLLVGTSQDQNQKHAARERQFRAAAVTFHAQTE